MSAKSKRSSRNIDRPFAAGILAEAHKCAEQYQVILSRDDGEWHGRGLEFPHVFGEGKTAAECVASTIDAMTAAVAYLLEKGEQPPAAARESVRTEQVNIRLTAEERIILETAARTRGFRGLSDFVRSAALEATKV
jgi:predicted RNase H-like HicB family nuclease